MHTSRKHRLQRTVIAMLAVAALSLSFTSVGQAAPTVNDLNHGVTPTNLANSLVGGGVTISNVTYTGGNRAAGTFSAGAASIGFASGIVLDSGKVQTVDGDPLCSRGVEGPNSCHEPSSGDNSSGLGTAGDAGLTSLSGHTTHDASVLEFDFVPEGSTVQFNYVFSSDEYNNYANTNFNDVFGFFINGTNCALVPGTSDPVSINTINNGNPGSGEDPTPHHPELFRDNVRPSPSIDSQMDGLTTVLTCNAPVNAGQTNHLKLAIADATDSGLDSAVFLQGGSFVSTGGKISARGTVEATKPLTGGSETIGFSAANNCNPSLSTRPSIVGTTDGGRIWTKSSVTESECTDLATPASPLGFDTQEGTATGTFGPASGGLGGEQGTLTWGYHDGSPDTVAFDLTLTGTGDVVYHADEQVLAPYRGAPGGVWTFAP